MEQKNTTGKHAHNDWKLLSLQYTNNTPLEIFSNTMIAIKELLQGGTVEAGDDGECMVKIYQDDKGKMHLLIANTADEPADTGKMLDLGDSDGETISSAHGTGIKSSLAFFCPNEKDKGHFIVATRYEEGEYVGDDEGEYVGQVFYEKSPYNPENMIHGWQSVADWPVDKKYRTYIDTEIDNWDTLQKELSYDHLSEMLGVIFGPKLEKGMKLHLETPEQQGLVAPNLPYSLVDHFFQTENALEKFYDRKSDPKEDDPALIVRHYNEFMLTKEDTVDSEGQSHGEFLVKSYDYCSAERAEEFYGVANTNPEKGNFWRNRQASQGYFIVLDDVIQSYIGVKPIDNQTHPSMNGFYTFLNIESVDGSNLIYSEESPFDTSKTSIDFTTKFGRSLKAKFEDLDLGKFYHWHHDVETEKEYRQYFDKLLVAEARRLGIDHRYIRECRNNEGKEVFDGAIVKFVSSSPHDKRFDELSETEQQKYMHTKMPSEHYVTIVEYKKSAITKKDLDQMIDYIQQCIKDGEVPENCIFVAPTIEKEALDSYIKRIGELVQNNPWKDAVKTWGTLAAPQICLRLTNTEWNQGYDAARAYSKKELARYIDKETFERITSTYDRKSQYSFRNVPGFEDPDRLYGSIPLSVIFKREIVERGQELASEQYQHARNRFYSAFCEEEPEQLDDEPAEEEPDDDDER